MSKSVRISRPTSCGPDCLLIKYDLTKAETIPLGGTRPNSPGQKVAGQQLIVTNVFTRSTRLVFPVSRTLSTFREIVTHLQQQPISQLVTVIDICACSTAMEYLNGYQILDNSSPYTPPQHRSLAAWADQHSPSEGKKLINQILLATKKLHRRNIIHTDITGFNIFVTPNGSFKILDLFSCITTEAIKPGWLPLWMKAAIGRMIERKQIEKYLLRPLRERWNEPLRVNWKRYRLG